MYVVVVMAAVEGGAVGFIFFTDCFIFEQLLFRSVVCYIVLEKLRQRKLLISASAEFPLRSL